MKKLKASLISLMILCISIVIASGTLAVYDIVPWWFMVIAGLGAISYEIIKLDEWFGFDYEEGNSK